MAFFYNLLVTVAFVVCALLFLLVFQRDGKHVHLWLAIMFVLFVFDNLLLYMDELMPGFAALAAENRALYLTASNVSGLLITFDYDRVVRYNRSAGPHRVPWLFWGVLAAAYVGLGILGESPWANAVTLALRGIVPIAVILAAMRPAEGDPAEPAIDKRAVHALIAFQVANSVEMVLAYLGIELMPGRFVTIEAMSIAGIVWGVWYCLRILGSHGGAPAEQGEHGDVVAAAARRYALTEREREILELLYEGCTNQEIAARAFISEGTVKTHVHNIFRKTGSANRVQLLRAVTDAGRRA